MRKQRIIKNKVINILLDKETHANFKKACYNCNNSMQHFLRSYIYEMISKQNIQEGDN